MLYLLKQIKRTLIYHFRFEVSNEKTNPNLAQKFGLLAIGECVCQTFGNNGVFYGVVTAYRKDSGSGLYSIQYTDGDKEDTDLEEYNYAYALFLREEEWHAEDIGLEEEPEPNTLPPKKNNTKKPKENVTALKHAKLHDILDLTSTSCIAGKHLQDMDANEKNTVVDKLTKTVKQNENKLVTAAVLAVTYDEACRAAFVKHLEAQQMDIIKMVHPKRKSIIEAQGFLSTIKVGDWVDVESDYSP